MAVQNLPPNNFYVYVLFREDGTPFYIGKGRGQRWLQHEQARERGRNTPKANIIKKTIRAIGEVPKIKVAEGLSERDALFTEAALIAALGRKPLGPLTNLSDGGEHGQTGYTHTQEARAKMSIARKGRKHSAAHAQNIAASLRGKPHGTPRRKKPITEDDRERTRRMGLSNRGRKATAASRKKMSESRLGVKWSDAHRSAYEKRYGWDKQLKLPLE